ncbi:MAG: SDR family oxidoreductase [Deltaproteobacteria bacterium]|nr:MAG: SDR family oxidoreductase [Deltaproteobacteria bacterium]
MQTKLEGRVALVTGASRGLGRAIALKLAAEGACVALNYRSGELEARKVADEIAAGGGKSFLLRGDVSIKEEARGIVAFTESAAIELARYNVTVNAIAPGFTETDMLAKVAPEVRQQILAKIPMGRFGQPEEIAKAVSFLCTDGDYVTGQQINVNGGVYM